jgi:ribosomal protein L34E
MIHVMAHCDICGYMIADITTRPDSLDHSMYRLIDDIKKTGANVFYENKFVCLRCVKEIINSKIAEREKQREDNE